MIILKRIVLYDTIILKDWTIYIQIQILISMVL
jgi:hypothetical protein